MQDVAGLAVTEGKFETTGGLGLFYRAFRPAGTPRAVVVIVPGFNAHSGYFVDVGTQLAAAGFAAYAIDLRGRGRSDGERFYIDSINDYVSDVHGLVGIAKGEHPGLKLFVIGHSAGGVVSCMYTLAHQEELSGLVCASFAFQVPAPDFALAVLKGLSHLAPHAHVLALKNADFSRDPAAVAVMDADPLIAHETQPTKTVAELARADEKLKQSFEQFKLPVLILHGTEDKATKPSGSQFFFDHAGTADKTLKLYQGHVHDLFNDLGKEVVMADITAWLAQHA